MRLQEIGIAALFTLFTLFASACNMHYAPQGKAVIDPRVATTIAAKLPVDLKNNQPSGAKMEVGRTGKNPSRTVVGDLHGWTATVIRLADAAIHGQASPEAGAKTVKKLDFKILRAKTRKGEHAGLVPVVRSSCRAVLMVTTGDGKARVFEDEEANFYAGWKNACETVTRRLVEKTLSDRTILDYLRR